MLKLNHCLNCFTGVKNSRHLWVRPHSNKKKIDLVIYFKKNSKLCKKTLEFKKATHFPTMYLWKNIHGDVKST